MMKLPKYLLIATTLFMLASCSNLGGSATVNGGSGGVNVGGSIGVHFP